VRIGFVGCGRHAKTSLYPILSTVGIELVATCARTLSHAQETARTFGAQHAYDDAAAMIAAGGIDAVVVAVPPPDYAALVRLCLDSRLPVFLEKPGAGSAGEAAQLAAEAGGAGTPVMVGYMKRFAPAYRRALEHIRDEAFGAPSTACFTFMMGDFGTDLETYLLDNPVHHLDLARFLVGELHDVVARALPSTGGRHAVTVLASTAAGAPVSFQLGSMGSWFQHNESAVVHGVGSSVTVDNVDTCILRPSSPPEQVWRPNYTVPLPPNMSPTTMGFAPALAHFRSVVQDGVACESDLGSAAATLALVEEVVRQVAR
jgi:predicted dehydrogenase